MKTINTPITAYKGFNKDLTCRGFQYEIGKTYRLPEGQSPCVCSVGFHACPNPADLFVYYPPCDSNRYCIVELSGIIDDSDDDKLAASEITIIREVTPTELANLHKEYVESHLEGIDKKNSTNNTGNRSSASNTGYYSSASNTGDYSSAEVSGRHSCAAVFGKDGKVRGSLGCAIFLTERGDWNNKLKIYPIVNVLAVIVDGKKVKADTWYKLVDGKLTEVN